MPSEDHRALSHLITTCGFKQRMVLPELQTPHLSEKTPHLFHARQVLRPSYLQLPSFSAQPKQKEEELRALKTETSSTLLTPCSSSTSQIWKIFSFAAVSILSWGPGKQGQTAVAFLQKRAFAACLPAEGQCPVPWGRQISSPLSDICTVVWNTAK